jgi:hypothetical protein
VQLAKSIGYKVVGVCSERNFDLVKSYGADEVVDYRDGAKAKEDIKRITNGGVNIGLDCISEGDSFDIALGGFKKGEKGRLNALLPPSDFAKNFDENIHCDWTLAYTVFGKAFDNVSVPFCDLRFYLLTILPSHSPEESPCPPTRTRGRSPSRPLPKPQSSSTTESSPTPFTTWVAWTPSRMDSSIKR